MRFLAAVWFCGAMWILAAAGAAVGTSRSNKSSNEIEMGESMDNVVSPATQAPDSTLLSSLQQPWFDPETSVEEGRGGGLLKRAALPFLLGLKVLAGAVAPALLALVALGTWKATTFALLSLVLSGALLLLKLAAPKSAGVEVVHLPAVAPPVWEPHARAAAVLPVGVLRRRRDASAQQLPFRAYAAATTS